MKAFGAIFISTALASQMSLSQATTTNTVTPDVLTRICSGDIRQDDLSLALEKCNMYQLNRNYAELSALQRQYTAIASQLDKEIRIGQKEKFKVYAYGTAAVVLGVVSAVSGLSTIAIASDGLKSALKEPVFKIAAPVAIVGVTLTVLSTLAAREASIAAEISAAQVGNFKTLLGSLSQDAETRKVQIAGLIKMKEQMDPKQ